MDFDKSPIQLKHLKRSNSEPILSRLYYLQSPHKTLRPFSSFSSLSKSLSSPVSSSFFISSHYKPYNLDTKRLDENQREKLISICLKKGTTEHSRLMEDINFGNDIIINIIRDYNRFNDKILDVQYFISKSNEILLEYINSTDLNISAIYEAYDAYEFIILSNVVSFWIFYKFMVDDNSLNTSFLEYHINLSEIYFNMKHIIYLELDILKTIKYEIYRFI